MVDTLVRAHLDRCLEVQSLGRRMVFLPLLADGNRQSGQVKLSQSDWCLLESMLDATEEQALEELRKKAQEGRERFLGSAQI